MTNPEIGVFTAFLRCASNYLEFGAGGSTIKASEIIAGKIFTVDSSSEWLNNVANNVHGNKSRLHLEHVDIGPVREWGYPSDVNNTIAFEAYSTSVWKYVDTQEIDLYLIDGRFRVSCFAECVKHARNDAFLIVHDYNSRKHYHEIETISRKIASIDDLAVFSTNDVSKKYAGDIATRYRFDPS